MNVQRGYVVSTSDIFFIILAEAPAQWQSYPQSNAQSKCFLSIIFILTEKNIIKNPFLLYGTVKISS